jgi:hypothetical protein
MGGHIYKCTDCGTKHYVYNGCGNSRCMLCQNVKREQWIDKLRNNLLDVPYIHVVFTVPHQLNSLIRLNPTQLYSITMKSSWLTIAELNKKYSYTSGMTSVLHTFGSDLKYHVHVHALVTFGGIDMNGNWKYPRFKTKIERYETVCKIFRKQFLKLLCKYNNTKNLKYHQPFEKLIDELKNIRWVVHSTSPTINTEHIENYLARYINRVAISPSRLTYNNELQLASIHYNDYKNQIKNQAAPKSIKNLQPIDAINQILQHCLPPYFQKSRSYGLHNMQNSQRKQISIALLKNIQTIRTLFQILYQILKINPMCCQNCGSQNLEKSILYHQYPVQFNYNLVLASNNKSPPYAILYRINLNQLNLLSFRSDQLLLESTKSWNFQIA